MTNQEAVSVASDAAQMWLHTMTVDQAIAAGYVDPDSGLTDSARGFLRKYLRVAPECRTVLSTLDDAAIEAAIDNTQSRLLRLGEALFR